MEETFGPCPKCGSSKVLRSRRRGLKERILKWISPGIRFYRCHNCQTRFQRVGHDHETSNDR